MQLVKTKISFASAPVLSMLSLALSGCIGPSGPGIAPTIMPGASLIPDNSGKVVQSASSNFAPKHSVQLQGSAGARNYDEVDGTDRNRWMPVGEASLSYMHHLQEANIDIAVVGYSNFLLSHGGGLSMRWKLPKGRRWVVAPGFSLGWAWGSLSLGSAFRLAPKHWVFGEVGGQLSTLGPELRGSIGLSHRITPRFSLQYGVNHRVAFSVHPSDYRRDNPNGSAFSQQPTFSLSPVIHF